MNWLETAPKAADWGGRLTSKTNRPRFTGMDDAPRSRKPSPCPICGKPAVALHRPFCSERCKLLDLGNWLGGRYRVASDERPEDAQAGDTPAAPEDEAG